MGTGKTTVGRIVAAELRFDFIDTDRRIEEDHGPIRYIFENQGEAAFRQIEGELAHELAGLDGVVISTGGRMMLDPANREALRNSQIYCLTAEPDELVGRLTDAGVANRPLLQGPEPRVKIVELLEERRSSYELFEQIPTDGRTPEAIAADIITRI